MALIHISGKSYELIFENRNGWNLEAFRNRYSEVLERYDFIVGDWGYNQLRLKGFFRDGHQKATKDSVFSYATDYINEYCNFGCAYFVLEKKQDSSMEPDTVEPLDELDEESKELETPKNNTKPVHISAAPQAKSEHRKKQIDKDQASDGIEKYFDKLSDKQKQRNRQQETSKNNKFAGEDAASDNHHKTEKKEGNKNKRKPGKNHRSFDKKKNKNNNPPIHNKNSNPEQISSAQE